jgi:D-3-phosphoglycerate dehydrogenase / 2-oxoglutarate reductase
MPTIVAMRGAADIELLGRAVPTAVIHEADPLKPLDPELARIAQIVILRSGARLDIAHITQLPKLRHVIRAGSGLDGLNLEALAFRGIKVHRNPGPAADAVAEWALVALLSLARRIPYGQAALTVGHHAKAACLAEPVNRLRLAIWGAGPVGRACGELLTAHVGDLAYAARPSVDRDLPQKPARELSVWADVHLVALPLTAQTRRMFGPDFLSVAHDRSPLLICVGRLGTLDVTACLSALARGDLGGLALDPVEQQDLPLLPDGCPPLNLLVTPHIGAQRTDVRAALNAWVAVTARALFDQGRGQS